MKKEKRSRRHPPHPDGTTFREGTVTEDGVVLLSWRVEVPAFDAVPGKTGAASFYHDLAGKVEEYLTGDLAAALRVAYAEADPTRRRFTFRRLIYRHEITELYIETTLTVVRTVSVVRAGKVLFSRCWREVWDPSDLSPLFAGIDDQKSEKIGKNS